jgi:thiol-disulfide isomerase/thioredoxin
MKALLCVFAACAALTWLPAQAAVPAISGEGIRWFQGDVDAAFAQAKREQRPLFLYWGAVWCPPCNQVKATVFNRQDFIEASRPFVPVTVDGDAPNAQQLGTRFKVSGYPTLVVFRPDGTEITRLPGEVDGEQILRVLALGVNATRPVRELLTQVNQGAPLAAADWRLLAWYSWETDQQSAVAKDQEAAVLVKLAQAVPAAERSAATRLKLKALAAVATAPEKSRPAYDRAGALATLNAVLADPAVMREHYSAVATDADKIAAWSTAAGSAERSALLRQWDGALAGFATDARLSQADRLDAQLARVRLAQSEALGSAKAPLPAALVDDIRAAAARADRDTADKYERQAVISSAGYLLREAGLMAESDALLQRELARSPAPYYVMLSLGSNARKRGDTAAALDWYAQAWQTSVGPATRLQWGATWVRNLIELAPQDAARIEAAARSVLGELTPTAASFAGRNATALERLSRQLVDWAQKHQQQATLERLRAQTQGLCAKLPGGSAERTGCDGLFSTRSA